MCRMKTNRYECFGQLLPCCLMLSHHSQVDYYRQRVEHAIGVIKKHAMFRQPYRGAHVLLHAMVRMTVHMTNIKLRQSDQDEEGIARYPGYNYGRHDRF